MGGSGLGNVEMLMHEQELMREIIGPPPPISDQFVQIFNTVTIANVEQKQARLQGDPPARPATSSPRAATATRPTRSSWIGSSSTHRVISSMLSFVDAAGDETFAYRQSLLKEPGCLRGPADHSAQPHHIGAAKDMSVREMLVHAHETGTLTILLLLLACKILEACKESKTSAAATRGCQPSSGCLGRSTASRTSRPTSFSLGNRRARPSGRPVDHSALDGRGHPADPLVTRRLTGEAIRQTRRPQQPTH
ncbi:unnamed protein product [Vitrella brassicaformis CCMP3155]|uniref:Uncharacterized protein n=1 Tax=Vitrella brassicaformis (strain CCMP3155) TaxID=1169540 RepID=A0A0G4FQ58_VITBC|nr:unnamed protein product [Vitrella brassicaformis CCMP3155]|eukprot:CEM16572.1 unnamed protein product [Vitrella brassicaformis CCMP3155]